MPVHSAEQLPPRLPRTGRYSSSVYDVRSSLWFPAPTLILDFFQMPVKYNINNITEEMPLLTTTEYHILRTPIWRMLSQNHRVRKRNTHSLEASTATVTSVCPVPLNSPMVEYFKIQNFTSNVFFALFFLQSWGLNWGLHSNLLYHSLCSTPVYFLGCWRVILR